MPDSRAPVSVRDDETIVARREYVIVDSCAHVVVRGCHDVRVELCNDLDTQGHNRWVGGVETNGSTGALLRTKTGPM